MIYFIRHGESEANLKHVFAGQKDDSPLTDKGREQAKAEGLKIKEMGLKIDHIISSPLIRAYDTAKIVADIIGYINETTIDERITEYDMGSLTGAPMFKISSKELVAAQGAEDSKKFLERVQSFFNEWSKKDDTILMVCHAGVGRIIETIKQNGDPELFYDIPAYPNAEVIKLDWLG
jgi:probable phosphoglycerate mutase